MPVLHPNVASTLSWFGELEILRHDFTAAEAPLRRAISVYETLGDATQLRKAQLQLGLLYARSGRCKDALPLFAKPDPSGLVDLGEGICKHSVASLERATQARATLLEQPLAEFALAQLLVHADKRRAMALAEAARDGFARYAGAVADRAAVEAWLASIP